jgi:ribonucleotide reductase beta subunit family protein with ferritin-like domain
LWGFYPLYGFVGCVILVLVATWIRKFLIRDENYYEKQERNITNEINKNNDTLENKFTTKEVNHHVDD